MYKIIGADGKEYGPVGMDQLRTWVDQSRISPQTKVLPPGSEGWRLAGEIPELAALFTEAPSRRGTAPPLLKPTSVPQPKRGLAVFSFVLGLCSFVLCLNVFTGVPAVIVGHLARRRATRQPNVYGGVGLAKAGIVLGYLSVFVSIGILALVLQQPTIRRARVQQWPGQAPISAGSDCQDNLRQLGLAFKVWALEHNDQYPFNVSSNAGGSMELCVRGADGFEQNPVPHLQIIGEDLSTPAFLVCPQDRSKHPAPDFASLTADNITYQLRTGTNINADHPHEVLARCPIHGNQLYVDGNVRKK